MRRTDPRQAIHKPNGLTLGGNLGFRLDIKLIYPVTAAFRTVSGASSPRSIVELCARIRQMPAMRQIDAIGGEGLRILHSRFGEKPACFETDDCV